MGTHETNDDGAMGLERFDEMTGPMDNASGGYLVPASELAELQKVHAVIADEQRMADVFAECALAVEAMRQVQDALPGAGYERRLDLATRLSRAADSLESAIARANGGAA